MPPFCHSKLTGEAPTRVSSMARASLLSMKVSSQRRQSCSSSSAFSDERSCPARRMKRRRFHFSIRDSSIWVEPFDLVSEKVVLGVGGRIGLDGPVELKMRVRAPRGEIDLDEVGKGVLDALTDDAGFVQVPFEVRGTFEDPRVVPAWDAFGESTIDAAIDAAKDALKQGGAGRRCPLARALPRSGRRS